MAGPYSDIIDGKVQGSLVKDDPNYNPRVVGRILFDPSGHVLKDPVEEDPGLAADKEAARAAREGIGAQYDNFQARPVPTASAAQAPVAATAATPQLGTAATAAGPNGITAERTTAATAYAPGNVVAPQIQQAPRVNTPIIGGVGNGDAVTYQAARVAPVTNAQATGPQAASIATGPQDTVRTRQMALLGQLDDQIAGRTGPSAAEIQARKSADDAISTQLALTAGVRGGSAAAAQRAAGRNVAAIQQRSGLDAALVRANETQQARGQLISGFEGTRGADIRLATDQAGMEQQANVVGAQLQTSVSQSNAQAANVRGLTQAQLEQQAAAGNAQAQNELTRQRNEIDLRTQLANQQAQIEADKANQAATQQVNLAGAGMSLDAQRANQSAGLQTNLANAGFQQQSNLSNADAQNRMSQLLEQLRTQNGQFNAAQANEFARLQAQLTAQTSMFNAGQTNQGNQFNTNQTNQVALANLDAALKARGLDDAQRRSLLDAYVATQGQLLGQGDQALARAALEDKREAGVMGMGAGLLSTLSDKRAKKEIRRAGDRDVRRMLEAIRPYTFKYKNPDQTGAAGGERFGVMAQDLERSKLGRTLIRDEGGAKRIDGPQAVGALLAALASMNDRVAKVEAKAA